MARITIQNVENTGSFFLNRDLTSKNNPSVADISTLGRVYGCSAPNINTDNRSVYSASFNDHKYNHKQVHGFYNSRRIIDGEVIDEIFSGTLSSYMVKNDENHFTGTYGSTVNSFTSHLLLQNLPSFESYNNDEFTISDHKDDFKMINFKGTNTLGTTWQDWSRNGNNPNLISCAENASFFNPKADQCYPLIYNQYFNDYGDFNISTADLFPCNILGRAITGVGIASNLGNITDVWITNGKTNIRQNMNSSADYYLAYANSFRQKSETNASINANIQYVMESTLIDFGSNA